MVEASQTEQTLLSQVLEPAKMDPSRRKACLEGTRRNIIDPILHWADDLSADPNIHWLCGDAGLGKSAVAHSVANEHPDLCGAYLFFDRNDPTSSHPTLVIRTIAYKLAMNNSTIRVAILEAIEKNPKIATESLSAQYTTLLHEPLTACQHTLGSPILVILDALDECGDDKTRRVLVDLIAKRFTSLPLQLKFLITSRGESDIVEPFMSSSNGNHIDRVELLPSTEDVLKFLYDATHKIRNCRPSCRLSVYWPGTPTVLKLMIYMEGVFILASTVASFVEHAFHPQTSLEYLLISNSPNSTERLNSLYGTVLESIGDWEDASLVNEFRDIVGAIIVGQAPMTVRAIDELLGLKRSSSTILSSLRFLLQYSEDKPIRTLHASIAEYLTDPERCGSKAWFINTSDRHLFLVGCCLRLMKERLHFNMCGLETSHLLNKDVPGLRERVRTSISDSLVYACQHFATHLHLSNIEPSDFDGLADVDAFLHSQFLFWLEALSLVNEDKAVTPAMEILEQWYRHSNKELAEFASEVVKFQAVFRAIISQSTPHLYISAVPMWRDGSHIRRVYGHKLREIVRRGTDTTPALQTVIRGHTSAVRSVGFSPDGKRIVSGSEDNTVRIWDAEIGPVVTGPFHGHTFRVMSVGFSPEGKRVVSGSWDSTVWIWNAETGSVVTGPLEGHTDCVSSVAFSPDGRLVVSGSFDKTVRVWDAETGSVVAGPFKGHTALVAVRFSPDGWRVISGFKDNTVRIWDASVVAARYAKLKHTILIPRLLASLSRRICHSTRVLPSNSRCKSFQQCIPPGTSVGFSPDGKRIVSVSDDYMACIWEIETGSIVAGPFRGHTYLVRSVGFSPDGKRVVSASMDKTVRIWDAETGSLVAGPFEGGPDSVAFSPDGKRIVFASDYMVRVWDVETGSLVAGPFEGHTDWPTSVGFSPDGKRVVSGSCDQTVRIWDAETGPLVAAPSDIQDRYLASLPCAFDSQDPYHHPRTWKLDEDGWLRSPSGALVLWIPHYYPRPALCLPPAVVIMGLQSIEFDLSRFVHGERWVECFDDTL